MARRVRPLASCERAPWKNRHYFWGWSVDRRTLVVGLIVLAGVAVLVVGPNLGSLLSGEFAWQGLQERPTPGARSTLVIPTVDPEALPPGAESLAAGDFGIEQGGMGQRGTLVASDIRCEGPVLRIDTEDGSFLATVPQAGEWNCGAALAQWRRVSATSSSIGLRYVQSPAQLILLDESGRSMTIRVGAAWHAP